MVGASVAAGASVVVDGSLVVLVEVLLSEETSSPSILNPKEEMSSSVLF